MQDTNQITQLYMASLFPEINIENLMTILTDIKMIGRPIGDDPLWTLMSSPVLQKSFDCFLYVPTHLYHISSSVTSNQVWVSNDCEYKLFLNTKAGGLDECECITDFIKNSSFGIHTLNRDNELIYIDENLNIEKSSDLLSSESLTNMTDSVCVYCSPSSWDLTVGMRNNDVNTGKIIGYNNTGRHTQTLPHNSIPHNLYSFPIFITENNNEDVVVAHWKRAVVVTSREGVHRFSYKGSPPSGSRPFFPREICTYVMSHRRSSHAGQGRSVPKIPTDKTITRDIQAKLFELWHPHSLSLGWIGIRTLYVEQGHVGNMILPTVCVQAHKQKRLPHRYVWFDIYCFWFFILLLHCYS